MLGQGNCPCYLHFHRSAKALGFIGNPSTLFAKILRLIDKFFVIVPSAFLCAKIYQVTEVLVMSAMGQLKFFHSQLSVLRFFYLILIMPGLDESFEEIRPVFMLYSICGMRAPSTMQSSFLVPLITMMPSEPV